MKLLERILGLKTGIMLLLAAGAFASCNILDEEEEDCAVYVSFKYDYNMKFADAFAHSVKSVTLYAFDKDGKLAFQKTEEGSILAQEDYAMRLDEISRNDVGDYEFITWAGLADNESFTVPLLQPGVSTKEDLTCRLNRKHESRAENGTAIVDQDLEALFHGQISGSTASRSASDGRLEVSLTKNTNNIRIVLQHLSGEPVNADQFHFSITDENGLMNYDNSLLQDERLTYLAWDKYDGYAGLGESEKKEGITEINVAIAELTVARLMADERPILKITNKVTGEDVLTIPLIDYVTLVKGNYNRNMSDQEYLDRQDEYNMTFFLDEGNHWMNAYIHINSWHVILQHNDL